MSLHSMKNADKEQVVRMCVWIDADLRAGFARAVRKKHGGDRGGTGKEVSIALELYLKRSQSGPHYRKTNMNKLMDLAMELEDAKGYPDMYPRLLRSVVRVAVGKDGRTIQKYTKIVQAKSIRTRERGTVSLDVSPFVKEVYRCNHDGIDPGHIMRCT